MSKEVDMCHVWLCSFDRNEASPKIFVHFALCGIGPFARINARPSELQIGCICNLCAYIMPSTFCAYNPDELHCFKVAICYGCTTFHTYANIDASAYDTRPWRIICLYFWAYVTCIKKKFYASQLSWVHLMFWVLRRIEHTICNKLVRKDVNCS